jgi:hypothetical protein
MAITETTFNATVGSSASTLFTISTEGVYDIILGLENLADGDVFEFWIEDPVLSGGTAERIFPKVHFADAQSEKSPVMPGCPITVKHSVTVKAQKIAGTDRTIRASLRRVSSGS